MYIYINKIATRGQLKLLFCSHTHTHTHRVKRVFTKDPVDQASIPGRVIPKTKKNGTWWRLVNTQHYKVQIKSMWSNPRKWVAPSHTPWCSSLCKRSLRVALVYGRQLYLYIHMYRTRIFGQLHISGSWVISEGTCGPGMPTVSFAQVYSLKWQITSRL